MDRLAPGLPADRHRGGARARTPRRSCAPPAAWSAKGRDPYFAPWPDVVAAQRVRARPARRRRRDADRDRRPVRRAALRHGDADDQRGLRAHVGRAGRAGAADRLLAHADRAHQGRAPGLPVHRRGVLGHGVDAAAAGLRPLLRQAPLRPAGARVRRVGARAPAGRQRLPGAPDPVHREPRRAARGGHLRTRPGAGGRGRDVDACRARASTTTASWRAGERASRSSSAAAPTSRRTTTCARSTRGCCGPSPTPTCATATGACATATGWPDNDSYRQLVAWCWSSAGSRHLVVVNLADAPAQAQVRLPWDDLAGRAWELTDRLDGRRFEREGDELAAGRPVRRTRPVGIALPRLRALTGRPEPSSRGCLPDSSSCHG